MQLYWVFTLVGLVAYRTLAVSAQESTATQEYDDENGSEASADRVPTTTEVQSTTRDILDDIRPIVKDIQKKLYPAFSELLADENVSNECTTSLISMLRGVMNQKKWALMSE